MNLFFIYLKISTYETSHLCLSFQMNQNPSKSKCPAFVFSLHERIFLNTSSSSSAGSCPTSVHRRSPTVKKSTLTSVRQAAVKSEHSPLYLSWFSATGHPQEASGEGSVRAAVSDRSSLHPEEEGGRGAHRPRQ